MPAMDAACHLAAKFAAIGLLALGAPAVEPVMVPAATILSPPAADIPAMAVGPGIPAGGHFPRATGADRSSMLFVTPGDAGESFPAEPSPHLASLVLAGRPIIVADGPAAFPTSGPVTAVPEPATLTVLAVATIALRVLRGRRAASCRPGPAGA